MSGAAGASTALSAIARGQDPAFATLPAVLAPGETLTFAALGARVAAGLGHLRARGVGTGDRVGFVGGSDVDAAVTFLAIAEAGALAVPLHPRLMSGESAALVELAGCDHVLDAEAMRALATAEPQSPTPTPARPEDDAPLALVFTSGTSGRPKGALLSRRAFVASALASAANLPFAPGDVWLSSLSLAHVGGLGAVTKAMVNGGVVALEARFDPDRFLERISRDRVTLLSAVPTMLDVLLEHDAGGVLGRLHAVLLGGAAASPALLDRCASRRVLALTTYGLTEACSQVTTQAPRDPGQREDGAGRAIAGVDVVIRGAGGAALAAGEVGRITFRGPTLMLGYDRGPGRAPDSARDADGFFDTGDLGELDASGRLFVHARRTDLIVTGGENVYPIEVEQVLEAEPGVRRAVVFGVPDPRWGHVVAVAIALEADRDPSAIISRASARLAPHKRPRRVAVVAEVALNPSGKVERKDAAARYGAHLVEVSAPPPPQAGSPK